MRRPGAPGRGEGGQTAAVVHLSGRQPAESGHHRLRASRDAFPDLSRARIGGVEMGLDVLGMADVAVPALAVVFPYDLPARPDHVGLDVSHLGLVKTLRPEGLGQLLNAGLHIGSGRAGRTGGVGRVETHENKTTDLGTLDRHEPMLRDFESFDVVHAAAGGK